MPDTNLPQAGVPESDMAGLSSRGHAPVPRRGWRCPNDDTVAAYLDGVLEQPKRRRLETHFAVCMPCRSLIADVMRSQGTAEPSEVPLGLISRAAACYAPRPKRRVWIWAPAATAVAVGVVIALTAIHIPEELVLTPPEPPSAPLIAKSESPAANKQRVTDVVRKPSARDLRPRLVFPEQGSTVGRNDLEFRWKAIPKSNYYSVRLVTSAGNLVWEGKSNQSSVKLPDGLMLPAGKYFVWLSVYDDRGRLEKSDAVGFQISSR